MMKQTYEDYKYSMMDTGFLYLGSKYSYAEIMENEDIPFKFRTIIERYIVPDMGMETTLESHLYYIKKGDFSYRTYQQLKAKVKISRLVNKKPLFGIFGKTKRVYRTEIISLTDLAELTKSEKEKDGIFIQELMISKLGMMMFTV